MDHQITEAILLAGGLGTRLRSAIGEIPKPMAPISDSHPFLDYIFQFLIKNGIKKAYLSVGYKWEIIENHYGSEYNGVEIEYVVEDERLGTGGGINLALKKVVGNNVYVINGDTFFYINLIHLQELHFKNKSICTLALKEMNKVDRYGSVSLNKSHKIIQFQEKKFQEKCLINGGIYLINKNIINSFPNQDNFSFENDFLESNTLDKAIYGIEFKNYFKDIGIPEDFKSFQEKMKTFENPVSKFSTIKFDKSWTLFLDRDGVINHQIINDYVKQVHELKIIDGVPEAISLFTKIFKRIVIVTNQQGIGKKLMTVDDLEHLNGFIINLIETYGGKIDKVYFAPQLVTDQNNYRKPGTGMGLHAQFDFPDIEFEKSLMIGDSEGDIEFGTKLGMKTIMLRNSRNLSSKANYIFENLQDVAKRINND